jgi:hypothetical protein
VKRMLSKLFHCIRPRRVCRILPALNIEVKTINYNERTVATRIGKSSKSTIVFSQFQYRHVIWVVQARP